MWTQRTWSLLQVLKSYIQAPATSKPFFRAYIRSISCEDQYWPDNHHIAILCAYIIFNCSLLGKDQSEYHHTTEFEHAVFAPYQVILHKSEAWTTIWFHAYFHHLQGEAMWVFFLCTITWRRYVSIFSFYNLLIFINLFINMTIYKSRYLMINNSLFMNYNY